MILAVTGPLQRRRIRRQAGGRAVREYETRKRQWRREKRRLFVGLGLVVAILFVVTYVPAHDHQWSYWGGVVFGCGLAFYVALRESPPPWIEQYQIGAWGEEQTARVVEPLLRRGWVALHDLSTLKANLDHVLTGPGGVFVLDSKNLHGTVEVVGEAMSLTRPGTEKAAYVSDSLALSARRQAMDVNRMLRQRGGLRLWVHAVVVVWADFPQQVAAGRNMVFVHGDHLVDWLGRQPARLNAGQIAEVSAALRPGRRRRLGGS